MSEKRMKLKVPEVGFVAFWIAVSALYALVFVGAEFAGSPLSGVKGFVTLAGQWAVVSLSAAMVIGLVAVNRQVFAAVFPVLMLASAVAAYFRLTMGLTLTADLIDLAAVNEWSTWVTVITLPLVAAAVAAMLLGCGMAWYRWRMVRRPRKQWVWVILFAIGLLVPIHIVPRFKAPVTARMPYSFFYAVADWMKIRRAVAEYRDTYEAVSAVGREDGPDVVLVIGESLRPDHLQLNGYRRPTTPKLAADTAVVSMGDVWTDHIYTHVSVPHIMTRADASSADAAYNNQSFITLFKKAGYRTAWLSNQDAVETYAYFMHEADTLAQCNSGRNLYSFDRWTDADLYAPLDAFMSSAGGRKMAVMHTIGSHWWYPSHYPDSLARFKPEADSRIVSELSREQIVNSYDNTILATDTFLAGVIDRLRGRNAVMIYISDHGEALGEDGNYLHAADYEPLHHAACLVWYSDEYARRYPEKVAALRVNADRGGWTTEAIFHTVLDGASIATPVLDLSKSMFRHIK